MGDETGGRYGNGNMGGVKRDLRRKTRIHTPWWQLSWGFLAKRLVDS